MIPSKSWRFVECRREGMSAGLNYNKNGISVENPYIKGTFEWESWENGFDDSLLGEIDGDF